MSIKRILLSEVTKVFSSTRGGPKQLKQYLIKIFNSKAYNVVRERRTVLRDVSLDINEGEFVGIMGRNGVGKSTILKILAGIYQPTTGRLKIEGRIAPVLELGAGFADELSGVENIYLNASILGFSRNQTNAKIKDIIDFSELGDQINDPVRNYSSGMLVRLAFSIACFVDADILLFDEVLAVGDLGFQHKCIDKIQELHAQKKTVILVSHSPEQIAAYCTRCILLDKGNVVFDGSAHDGANEYIKLFSQS